MHFCCKSNFISIAQFFGFGPSSDLYKERWIIGNNSEESFASWDPWNWKRERRKNGMSFDLNNKFYETKCRWQIFCQNTERAMWKQHVAWLFASKPFVLICAPRLQFAYLWEHCAEPGGGLPTWQQLPYCFNVRWNHLHLIIIPSHMEV